MDMLSVSPEKFMQRGAGQFIVRFNQEVGPVNYLRGLAARKSLKQWE
jgi:hypothetical protein